MGFRVAAVSFLNTVPLIEWLEDEGKDHVILTRALPSKLSGMLNSGAADVALLPVVEIFRGLSGSMIHGTGIACRGAVDSVKLFHGGDPGEIERIVVDRGSRTSVALLRILLAEMYGIIPPFTEVEPLPGWRPGAGEGALVIGDRCFEFENEMGESDGSAVKSLDLGEAWYRMTGLPFVFAMWAVSPAFESKTPLEKIGDLVDLLATARDHGLSRLDTIAHREAARGRLGHGGEATQAALSYYFRQSLCYRIGDKELEGLRLFHKMCVERGITPDRPFPSMLTR